MINGSLIFYHLEYIYSKLWIVCFFFFLIILTIESNYIKTYKWVDRKIQFFPYSLPNEHYKLIRLKADKYVKKQTDTNLYKCAHTQAWACDLRTELENDGNWALPRLLNSPITSPPLYFPNPSSSRPHPPPLPRFLVP